MFEHVLLLYSLTGSGACFGECEGSTINFGGGWRRRRLLGKEGEREAEVSVYRLCTEVAGPGRA